MYYVNKFVFVIEKVNIQTRIQDETGDYYITKEGAYLDPQDVFEKEMDAKMYAKKLLEEFFFKKMRQIINQKVE